MECTLLILLLFCYFFLLPLLLLTYSCFVVFIYKWLLAYIEKLSENNHKNNVYCQIINAFNYLLNKFPYLPIMFISAINSRF